MSRVLELTDPGNKLNNLITPCFISPTITGLIPNLTPDIPANVPLFFTSTDFMDNSFIKKKKAANFLGIPEKWIFLGHCTTFNNFDNVSKKGFSFSSRKGEKIVITSQDYDKLIDFIQPQGCVCLYSQPSQDKDSQRQILKRTDAAKRFSKQYPNIITFATPDAEKANLALFVQLNTVNEDEIEKIKSEIAKRDSKLPRMVFCDGYPTDIKRLVEIGIDLFVLTLPKYYADRGYALTFEYDKDSYDSLGISLHDKNLTEHDHTPILQGCQCNCCRQHFKSYIHHLLNVKELLAGSLLMQHNIHHMEKYFEYLRGIIKNN